MTGTSAASLRSQICAFIGKNPNLLIADTPLSDWVKWDSRGSVGSYVLKMSSGELIVFYCIVHVCVCATHDFKAVCLSVLCAGVNIT